MANPEHFALLKQGVEAWNKWREMNPGIEPDLYRADLSDANLDEGHIIGADLHGVNLREAHLRWTFLRYADLRKADLSGADLRGVDLSSVHLSRADLRGANLSGADLRWTRLYEANLDGAELTEVNLDGADLYGTDLRRAILHNTIFLDTNLAEVKGLEICKHKGLSTLDFRTLQKSGPLPLAFLRGCGLSDLLIDYLPSLLNQSIQFYSCFISYASKDEVFAQRLYADLQNKRMRCWFASEDIQGGRKIYEQLGEAIRLHEKLLLVLSEHSMSSKWVKVEIDKARQREERERRQVLFSIHLVDYETIEQWECFNAHEIRDTSFLIFLTGKAMLLTSKPLTAYYGT